MAGSTHARGTVPDIVIRWGTAIGLFEYASLTARICERIAFSHWSTDGLICDEESYTKHATAYAAKGSFAELTRSC